MPSRKQSAGLLMYDLSGPELRLLIAHPGGPLFENKRDGHWGIPKGEFGNDEAALDAAKREFFEETNLAVQADHFIDLGSIIQKGGKKVFAWAFEGSLPVGFEHKSNFCRLEWPRNSGQWISIPEIDEIEMVDCQTAKIRMRAEQFQLVERLLTHLTSNKSLT